MSPPSAPTPPAASRAASPLPAVALIALALAVALAGCGEAAPGKPSKYTHPAARLIPKPHASAPLASARSHQQHIVGEIDASSDRIIAEGKVHIAAGAPSTAEIRREIKAARKAGVKLPSGESAASFENAPANSGGSSIDAEVPETPWNPLQKPIADWIVPILAWAHEHGWPGTVTSGYRTYYEQAQLNAAGAFSAPAGVSNHETTVYPGGAVDVTDPSQLIAVLRSYPGSPKLVGGVLGPVDPEHFSATGD